jgi:hypothetical protein
MLYEVCYSPKYRESVGTSERYETFSFGSRSDVLDFIDAHLEDFQPYAHTSITGKIDVWCIEYRDDDRKPTGALYLHGLVDNVWNCAIWFDFP